MKCENLASSLKYRMALQEIARSEDGQGGYTEEWVDTSTLWAGIEPLKGWERMQAMQIQTPVTHRILIRYRAGITTAKRLRWGTRVFDIKECIGEDRRWLRLTVVETGTVVVISDEQAWEELATPWELLDAPWGVGDTYDSLAENWDSMNTPWNLIG